VVGSVVLATLGLTERRSSDQRPRSVIRAGMVSASAAIATRPSTAPAGDQPAAISADPNVPDVPKHIAETSPIATPADRRESPAPSPADRRTGVESAPDAAIGPSAVRIVLMNAPPVSHAAPL
jgi:hypothetical protein